MRKRSSTPTVRNDAATVRVERSHGENDDDVGLHDVRGDLFEEWVVTSMADSATVFGRIYRSGAWHPRIRSGVGSAARHTRAYRQLLQRVLREFRVRSVVDLGCGDGNVAELVDWSGIEYLGLDVVSDVIDALHQRHAGATMRFECVDLIREDLPEAELAICKDVLQHWPNAAVHRLIERLSGFHRALLTNDISHHERARFVPWRRRAVGLPNSDIELGDWRPLCLLDPPFALAADEVARFEVRHGRRRWCKQVLLWTNPDRRSSAL